jgi:hypothetical protein
MNPEALQQGAVVPRLTYNRCGPQHGVVLEVDADPAAADLAIAEILPGDMRDPFATLELIIDERSTGSLDPAFATPNGRGRSVRIGRNEAALLVVNAKELAALAADGRRLLLSGTLTRVLDDNRPSPQPLHIELAPFRTGPPQAQIEVDFVDRIDIGAPAPADGHLVLGHITIVPENPTTRYRAGEHSAPLLCVDVAATCNNETIAAGLRPHRLRQDEDERIWRDAVPTFAEALAFDQSEAAFRIYRVDIGLDLAQLRAWWTRNRGQSVLVTVNVRIEPSEASGVRRYERAWERNLKLIGELPELVLFSELCDPFTIAATGESYVRTLPEERIYERLAERDSLMTVRRLRLAYQGSWPQFRVIAHIDLCTASGVIGVGDHVDETHLAASDAEIPVDLGKLVARAPQEAKADETLECRIAIDLFIGLEPDLRPSRRVVFDIPIRIERTRPEWLICVDFGTSATAIWIGRYEHGRVGMFLRLGEWLADIDPNHDESGWWNTPAAGPKRTPLFLLPSHIGLSPGLNLRADFDPLSLGNLALSLPGPEAARARLERLERTYDVSFPFPSRQRMAEHIGAIVTEPKKRMILRDDHVAFGSDVSQRQDGRFDSVRSVDLARLVEDCFDELGRYVAVNAVHKSLAASGSGADADVARRIEDDRLDGRARFAVVVTHPSGIDNARRSVYRRAGRRFLDGFTQRDAASRQATDVTLVPEAMAAARFGIQKFIDAAGEAIGAGKQYTFVTLDIGAGTYDVTIIDAQLTPVAMRSWTIRSHFGVAVGGNDLDRALAARIAAILRKAASFPAIAEQFEIEENLPLAPSDSLGLDEREREAGLRFLAELQGAKARLSERLLEPSSPSYIWQDRSEGGFALDIKVGTKVEGAAWPVRLRGRGYLADTLTHNVPDVAAQLVIERALDEAAKIRLDVWREALDERTADNLGDLVELMGHELPRLALAEHRRTLRAEPAAELIWIVTGRTALWPPLFAAIARTIREAGENAGRLLMSRPFPADEMKRAVVDGAFDLARRPWLLLEESASNPIAIVEYGGFGTGRRTHSIISIADHPNASGEREVETRGPFVIARMLPSLDFPEGRERRLSLLDRIGVHPWVELTEEIPIGDAVVRWLVRWERDSAGVRLTLEPRSGKGQRMSFGPFKSERVYGAP